MKIAAIIAGVMSLLALGSWPYGYYILLRWVVAGAAFFGAYAFRIHKRVGASVFFVLVGLLWNPIVPVYLDRETWGPLNVLAAISFFVLAAWSSRWQGPDRYKEGEQEHARHEKERLPPDAYPGANIESSSDDAFEEAVEERVEERLDEMDEDELLKRL